MAFISGIQQIGIGCQNSPETFKWLRKTFGINVQIFDDEAQAPLMTPYTGGEVHSRRAILAMNMNGGGGAEIWQFTSRTSSPSPIVQWGDLGINAVKMKASIVHKSYEKINKIHPIAKPELDPAGNEVFWVKDEAGNNYQVVKDESWFKNEIEMQGGICGAIIGVSNIDISIAFYQNGLGVNQIAYDVTGKFNDLGEDNKDKTFRRALLTFKNPQTAPFSKLLGDIQIELIQCLDRVPIKLFENRFWGDLGFIHLCFDVPSMERLKKNLEKFKYSFTVDSGDTFDMGESGGRFAYVEDPDGTLIEMVETHKVPIMKKYGWYLNLKKRGQDKPLPNWMVSLMGLNKIKD
ncbi:MAG: VOC family protein [Bacteroidia bacterium]|nr:VOC family protein [Bacteroidia bacterium]MCF8427636.1 VOC family protein [Bacteroidia bacterium]